MMSNSYKDIDIDNLSSLTVKSLKEICKNNNYHNHSGLRKKELVFYVRENILLSIIDEGINKFDALIKQSEADNS